MPFLLVVLAIGSPTGTLAQDRAAANAAQQVSTLRSAMNSFANDTRLRLDAMQSELDAFRACAKTQRIFAPDAANADAKGCVSVGTDLQTGVVDRPMQLVNGETKREMKIVDGRLQLVETPGEPTLQHTWEDETVTVSFEKPFANPPEVNAFITDFYFTGPCRGDTVDLQGHDVLKNVTRNGFGVLMRAHKGGCGSFRVEKVTWIAKEKD